MGFADRFGGGNKGGGGDNTDDSNENQDANASGTVQGGFSSKFAGNKPVVKKSDTFADGHAPAGEKGSFSDNISKKNRPDSFTDQVTRRGDLVYLVHGKDRGRDAWHYVLVDKPKLPMFLKQIETGSIDVALYGEVLRSGWGKNPPPEVVQAIEDEFS